MSSHHQISNFISNFIKWLANLKSKRELNDNMALISLSLDLTNVSIRVLIFWQVLRCLSLSLVRLLFIKRIFDKGPWRQTKWMHSFFFEFHKLEQSKTKFSKIKVNFLALLFLLSTNQTLYSSKIMILHLIQKRTSILKLQLQF